MVFLTFIGGLFVLLFASDRLVRGAVALANDLSVSPMIIGLTVVAFGTSAPELVIGIRSAFVGVPELALGTVIGGNIAGVLLILGVTAMVYPVSCGQAALRWNTPILLLVSVLLIILGSQGILTFWMGAALFALAAVFLVYAAGRARERGTTINQLADRDRIEGIPNESWRVAAFLLAGVVGLPLGAYMTVSAAETLAETWQIPADVIGLSLLALGVSLPELATTITAAAARRADMAVGNIVGSSIFNILAVLGLTAMIADIPVRPVILTFDMWVMLGAAVLVMPFVLTRSAIGRVTGAGFTVAYLLYIYALAVNSGAFG